MVSRGRRQKSKCVQEVPGRLLTPAEVREEVRVRLREEQGEQSGNPPNFREAKEGRAEGANWKPKDILQVPA